MIYAVRESKAMGQKKRSEERDLRHDGRTYSYSAYNVKQDVARQFGRWEEDHHPEITAARDIPTEHYVEWLNQKRDEGARQATLDTYRSAIQSIDRQMVKLWGKEPCRELGPVHALPDRGKLRDRQMDRADFDALRGSYRDGSTGARALDLARAGGLRVQEISRLRGSDIRERGQEMIIHVERSKGGRNRDIVITDRACYDSLRELRDRYGDERICPIKPDSLNKNIERGLERLGLGDKYRGTSFHAIRKMWAQGEYDRARRGMDRNHAIKWVNVQLGHGADRDDRLISVYVGNLH